MSDFVAFGTDGLSGVDCLVVVAPFVVVAEVVVLGWLCDPACPLSLLPLAVICVLLTIPAFFAALSALVLWRLRLANTTTIRTTKIAPETGNNSMRCRLT